jgi:hypothetical protein
MIFKLTDLAARFLGNRQANGACSVVTDIKLAQGIAFQCPLCSIGKIHDGVSFVGSHLVVLWFVGKVAAEVAPLERYTPTGKDLLTLTLTPPVKSGIGCYWSGSVTNGSVE